MTWHPDTEINKRQDVVHKKGICKCCDNFSNLRVLNNRILLEKLDDRIFEVEKKRTGAINEMYETGYYSALKDIKNFIKDKNT